MMTLENQSPEQWAKRTGKWHHSRRSLSSLSVCLTSQRQGGAAELAGVYHAGPHFLTITNYLNLRNFIHERDWFGSVKNPKLLGLVPRTACWRSKRSCHQAQRSGSRGSSLRDPVRFALKFSSWFTLPEKSSSPASEPLGNKPYPNHSNVWGNCKCLSHGQGGQAFLRVLWHPDPELSSSLYW